VQRGQRGQQRQAEATVWRQTGAKAAADGDEGGGAGSSSAGSSANKFKNCIQERLFFIE